MTGYALRTGKTNMSLIDALSAHIAVIDPDGMIIATNRAWDHFAHENGTDSQQSYGVGSNYFDICLSATKNGDKHALRALLGMKEVLRGRSDEFTLEYPCHSQDVQRWFRMRATRLNRPDYGLIIAHEDTTAQRLAEQKLRESESNYRLQFENSLECIIIATPEGEILDANPMALQTLGYTLEELQDIGRDGLIDPEDDRIYEVLKQRDTNGHFRGELNYRRADGTILSVALSLKISQNGSGEKRNIVTFRDITEQKRTKKKLTQEQSLSRAILDNLPGTFCMTNQEGYAVQWNKNLENVLGYTPEEIRSRHSRNFVCEKDHEKLDIALDQVFRNGESVAELDLLTKDGRAIPFYFVGVRFMVDGQPYLIALGLNLEEQAALENELNMSRELFTQLFDNSPIGIALISESIEIQMTNKGFTDIFGYTENEVIGKDLINLVVPTELQAEVRHNAPLAFTARNYRTETERLTKTGDRIYVMIVGIPVMLDGNETAAFVMFADISERKQLEETRKILLEKEQAARIQAEVNLHELENIFTNAPVASCMLEGPQYILAYANQAFKSLFDRELIPGAPISESLPGIKEQGFYAPLEQVMATGEPYFGQEQKAILNVGKDNQSVLYLTLVYRPFKNNEGEVASILIQAMDVTEQVLNRQAIQETLKQKEILLHEVHHRVKNNLALIASLLDLQASDTDDIKVASQLMQTQMRINSIARIHDLLYQHDNLVRIPFHHYLDSLMSRVADSFPDKKSLITIKSLINPIEMNVNQAIPCGLLVNEIMNHLYKYSLTNHEKGLISINIRERSEKIHMHFMLDNMYITKEIQLDKDHSLSINIIKTLVEQLGASMHIHQQPRFELSISFAKKDDRGSANCLLN